MVKQKVNVELYLLVHLDLWTVHPKTTFSASAPVSDYAPSFASSLPHSVPAANGSRGEKCKK